MSSGGNLVESIRSSQKDKALRSGQFVRVLRKLADSYEEEPNSSSVPLTDSPKVSGRRERQRKQQQLP
jgi:hypothetical protein